MIEVFQQVELLEVVLNAANFVVFTCIVLILAESIIDCSVDLTYELIYLGCLKFQLITLFVHYDYPFSLEESYNVTCDPLMFFLLCFLEFIEQDLLLAGEHVDSLGLLHLVSTEVNYGIAKNFCLGNRSDFVFDEGHE